MMILMVIESIIRHNIRHITKEKVIRRKPINYGEPLMQKMNNNMFEIQNQHEINSITSHDSININFICLR